MSTELPERDRGGKHHNRPEDIEYDVDDGQVVDSGCTNRCFFTGL